MFFSVQPSPIHGQGVFANCFVPKGTELGMYTGTICKVANEQSHYALRLRIKPSWFSKTSWERGARIVDATNSHHLPKYVNGSDGPASETYQTTANCRIGRSGRYTLTRDVQEGEEVFVPYGDEFWKN